MISKYFECEADKSVDYYRVIQTKKAYRDGRYFPLNEVVIADQKVDNCCLLFIFYKNYLHYI